MKLSYKRTASIGERMISFLIDHIIITVLFMVIVFNAIISSTNESDIISMITLLILLFSPIIYGMKDFLDGRSIGKRVFSIGVRSVDNPKKVPQKWRLLVRNLTIIIWPIEFLVIAFSSQGLRLGDMLAKTIVVKLEKTEEENVEALENYLNKYEKNPPLSKTKIMKKIAIAFSIFILLIILLVGGIGSIMKNNRAYDIAITQIESSSELKSEIGEIKGYGFMPTGSISITNGYGEAVYKIKVKGEKRSQRVFVRLFKEPNADWKIDVFELLD
ncbi:RDD family protein [Clostridium sediminicola]|uniref:RDD family protein n=1 Tax=Clostridium sediminicola TaxID=3114879 RepID=UPI003D16A2DB